MRAHRRVSPREPKQHGIVMHRRPNLTLLALSLSVLAGCVASSPDQAEAQEELHCREAHRFLVEDAGMAAVTDPEVWNDWRTRQQLPGCRVTAAGLTPNTPGTESGLFFEKVRAAGWTRTPDPRDAPNESSLRFRKEGSDCLFNFYVLGMLGTEAEGIVSDERVPTAQLDRYYVLAMCMPAMEAAPQD